MNNSDTLRTRSVEDEQELHLWRTSKRYMQGEIKIKDLEEIENTQALKLKKALVTIAKKKVYRDFTRGIKKYTGYPVSLIVTSVSWFS